MSDYMNIKDKYNLKFDYIIYKNGNIVNSSTNKIVKPYIDPRRPNQCPIIYLKKKDNKRLCIYLDQLVCESFLDYYDKSLPIIHKDDNIFNCSYNN